MDNIQFLLLGLGNGAVFAALGVGLVITFRSSGVVNFAVGAMALYPAYTYAFLREGQLFSPIPGTPALTDIGGDPGLLVSFIVAVGVSIALSLVVYLLIFRPLRSAPPVTAAVASIALVIVIQGVLALRVGTRPVRVDPILPQQQVRFQDSVIQLDRFWLAGIVLVLACLLALLYRRTLFGLRTRAVAQSTKGALVSSLSPDRIAAANWAITGAVVGVAGVLISPLAPLVPLSYTLFVIPALAAALLGQFKAIIPTALGGLALGMLASEATYLQSRLDWLPNWVIPSSGLPEVLPLTAIIVLLVLRSQPVTGRGSELRDELSSAPRPRRVVLPALLGLAGGTVAILTLSSEWRLALITSMTLAVLALSWVLVTGYGGQVSLAQLTLAGASGFLLSTFSEDWGLPFPVAPILAATGAMLVGVAVGLPALRVRGLNLAVVTLALAAALEAVWFRNQDFNGGSEGAKVPAPELFGMDLGIGGGKDFPRPAFAILVLVVLVGCAVFSGLVRRSPFGASLLAVRVNERSAAAAGIDVVRMKLSIFAMASFVAGLAGALIAYRQGVASFDLYTALAGLALFAVVYLSGITAISGALLAGVIAPAGLLYLAIDKTVGLGDWYEVIAGVVLIAILIPAPDGIAGAARTLAQRVRQSEYSTVARGPATDAVRATEKADADEDTVGDQVAAATVARDSRAAGAGAASALVVEDLTVSYGEMRALNRVSFEVRRGSATGLIGPNGAGKTTLLDALSGFTDYQGQVLGPRRELDGLPPHRRARSGVGRTFQSSQLCEDLSVFENVEIGSKYITSERAVTETIAMLGLATLADKPVKELSQGQRQLVSIGRAMAQQPDLLLLDEPAGGLDTIESGQLAHRLRAIAERGTAMLIVDHDMGLIMDLCDVIVVLDFGEVIAVGDPDEIKSSRVVADAYFGPNGASR